MSENDKKKGITKRTKKMLWIIGLMILVIAVTISPSYLNFIKLSNDSNGQAVMYMSQIVTNLFIIFGVVVALWQYIIYSRTEIEQRNKEIYEMDRCAIQKAIDLAEYYKDNIIEKYTIIKNVYNKVGVTEIIDNIPTDKMIRFDNDELKSNIKAKDIEKIKNAKINEDIIDILASMCILDEEWRTFIDEIATTDEDGNRCKHYGINSEAAVYKFGKILQQLMNDLEYFAMHFTKNTADESSVYQSLHVGYIRIVRALYYDISSRNSGKAAEKYYTNIIELYHTWSEYSEKQVNEENDAKSKAIRCGKRLNK